MYGAPLVLLPGMMCDARLFAPQIDALAGRAQIWVGDIGGHASIDAIARDVLDRVPFARFSLGGLSMGGIVAMAMLRAAPERIERLALLDTNHLDETPERQRARGPQIERVRAGGLREVLSLEMKPLYVAPERAVDQALLDLVLQMGLDQGPGVFERQSLALRDRADSTATLRAFCGPALVLCGREDRLCPVERHRLMASLMLRGRLVVVDGAGHLPCLEAPDAVTAALRSWLDLPLPLEPRMQSVSSCAYALPSARHAT